MELKTSDIMAALGDAKLHGPGKDFTFLGVSTDTRFNCRDTLFVALIGETFDGSAYLKQAKDAGALGALIGPTALNHQLPEDFQCFLVEDTLAGLQRLAGHVRGLNRNCRGLAVTGSNGKSTTKEMIASIVGQKFRTHATSGNFNNHIGVPLTILGIEPDTEFLITEIGANHPGEIRHLARLAEPDTSVITNIAQSHLEGFGSLDGVLSAKLELFEETAADGVCVYNGDDELLRKHVPGNFANTLSFGQSEDNDLRASEISINGQARPSFVFDGELRISLEITGMHNVSNALAAAAVGRLLSVEDNLIKSGLEAVHPLKMRTALKKIGNTAILDDSYNANPLSMREALKTLETIEHHGRRGIVAGEMLELGPEAKGLHEELARLIAAKALAPVVFVGSFAQDMKEVYLCAGGAEKVVFAAENADAAYDILRKELCGGELLLVKGSRGVHLELLIEKLEKGSV
jgi:UDP-N-acetylmuramoyl-tripeptide--D-alanyl-D-alanine ligase